MIWITTNEGQVLVNWREISHVLYDAQGTYSSRVFLRTRGTSGKPRFFIAKETPMTIQSRVEEFERRK